MPDGLRIFLLGGLVGATLAWLVTMLEAVEFARNSGVNFLQTEIGFAAGGFKCGNGIMFVMPAITIAVCVASWFSYRALRSRSVNGVICGVLHGALVAVTATTTGFFVWFMTGSENPEINHFHFLTLLSLLIYALPSGATTGGIAAFLLWQSKKRFDLVAKIPAIMLFPILIAACAGSVLGSIPPTKVTFLPERWHNEIEARHSMLPDLEAHYVLKGKSISDVEKLLGPSEVPDSPANALLQTNNYFWDPNSVLQVTYDRRTRLVEGYAIKSNFFPNARKILAQVPDGGRSFYDSADSGKTSNTRPNQFKVNNKTIESRELREERLGAVLEKFNIGGWSVPAAELENGDIFICENFGSKVEKFDQTWIVDPNTGLKRQGPNLHCGRNGPSTLTLHDGRVLIVGGTDSRRQISGACELFDPKTNTMAKVGNLLIPRRAPGIGELGNGDIVVASGIAPEGLDDEDGLTTTVELIHFGPTGTTHSLVGALKYARSEPEVLPLGTNQAVIVGGELGVSHSFKHHDGADLFTE